MAPAAGGDPRTDPIEQAVGGDPFVSEARARLETLVRKWAVDVDDVRETDGSLLAFGCRRGRRVVLKVTRVGGDEWHAGRVSAAFRGNGVVGVGAFQPGAVLLDELRPATPLAELVAAGLDDEATDALAGVIEAMMRCAPSTDGCPTAEALGRSFGGWLDAGSGLIPGELVREAAERYEGLCRTQSAVRLLHGDLHHHNVLLDTRRGWVAVDPKGVVAEVEYELGAALRNPPGKGAHLTAEAASRRVERFRRRLPVRAGRVLAWAFSQAVLAAIWALEDGEGPQALDAPLALAAALGPALR